MDGPFYFRSSTRRYRGGEGGPHIFPNRAPTFVNPALLVPMTLSDLERRGVMGQNFLADLIIILERFDLECPNLAE